MTGDKFVFMFDEGSVDQRSLLGGKGANLAEMTRIGLPVPPGFTISTRACLAYLEQGQFPEGLQGQVSYALQKLEVNTDKKFGGPVPLLLSVRSGAEVSMPGMMDTILNLGLNDNTVAALGEATGDLRFALDCYRRFITMFSNVVLKVSHSLFEELLDRRRLRSRVQFDSELSVADLEDLIRDMKRLVADRTQQEFPSDPQLQLQLAIRAVFDSWDNERARVYREVHRISDKLGTAVNVQSMVYGNMGGLSGTGVVFTRNPATGENQLYGEYLRQAQGEDVVAGIRTPRPINELEAEIPQAYEQLVRTCELLERHYGDLQDIEFTIEKGKLYLLQTRSAKRTAAAAIRTAYEMVKEDLIDRQTAILRVNPEQAVSMLHRTIDAGADMDVVARGLPASPGAAAGSIVFSADDAAAAAAEGRKVLLVRPETTPDDIHGILAAEGILTSRGGMTCHAAIVARGMGKPCVVGCEQIRIDLAARRFMVGDQVFCAGDVISVDGSSGRVIRGQVPMVDPVIGVEFETLLRWADEFKELGVWANADTPEDAEKAREFGATGIGLCRTEHMFMGSDRLPIVQRMIMAETREEREEALDLLLPIQQQDFEGILEAMAGYPVTIRLLDPPLHEFLPNIEELAVTVCRLEMTDGDAEELARLKDMLRKARALSEFNPMLGLRGCRLGIVYPEVYAMQARAIFQASAALRSRGVDVRPEIMIPLVGHINELTVLKDLVLKEAELVSLKMGMDLRCPVGTMIEIPRACLVAGSIANAAEFFSFGTNDLTQTVFGYSRDDAEGKFLHLYLEQKLLEHNPFVSLDEEGVGALMKQAVQAGREARSGLKIGICGEHGGDPDSIDFCHRLKLNYVSCSPFRVPVAQLAAAQAAIRQRGEGTQLRGE